ncbi:hypothetical protein HGRIS_010196 [Hohenbuehelia grisea]|uniref:F-box domain-containing protein n=1 Tax=Hohenbuehelia grisea TaxID=104357 RepID=A0ABR3J3J5_9AGAR
MQNGFDSPAAVNRCSQPPQYVRPSNSPVVDLPAELLLIIFKLVYEQFAKESSDVVHPHPIRDPAQFPYPIAAVCRRWASILSMVPEYWTSLVAYLDDDYPIDIASQLAWSRGLSFELTITKRDKSVKATPSHEAWLAHAIIATSLPHLHRCTALRLSVARSSSLPHFGQTFYGNASLLEELVLACRLDDGVSNVVWPPVRGKGITCPKLRTLTVNASNFMQMALSIPSWKNTPLTSLTIANFSSTKRSGVTFPLPIFLHTIAQLPNLSCLRVVDVDLSPLDGPRPIVTLGQLQTVYLCKISATALYDIVSSLPTVDHLSISKCALPSSFDSEHLPNAYHLSLDGIREITAPFQSAITFIRNIVFGVLTLTNCPGLAGEVCRLLGECLDEDNSTLVFPSLHGVTFENSPNIDPHDILKALDQRGIWYDNHGLTNQLEPYDEWRIQEVEVLHSCPPVESPFIDYLLDQHDIHVNWTPIEG